MIRIACTNCREVLTIDDAFAGGVCRCQHCGTIQTVPAATGDAGVAVGGPNLGGARVSANGSMGGTGYAEGTGLDDLAGAIASSGLSSKRLLRPEGAARPAAAAARRPAARQNLVPLFVGAGVVIALLLGVIVYLATRSTPAVAPPAEAQNAPAPAAPAAANFCGTPLAGDTVVYLLDRGTATQDIFDALKEAALRSAASLGSDHHFQIVFWNNGPDEVTAYPPVGTAYATHDNVEAARRSLADVYANGTTDIKPALALALSQHPDVIVVATAKGWELDEAWLKDVLDARGSAPVRFDTFSLGANNPEGAATPTLKTLAQRTGGTYAEVANSAL